MGILWIPNPEQFTADLFQQLIIDNWRVIGWQVV